MLQNKLLLGCHNPTPLKCANESFLLELQGYR